MWVDARLNWNDFLPEDQDMNKFVTEQVSSDNVGNRVINLEIKLEIKKIKHTKLVAHSHVTHFYSLLVDLADLNSVGTVIYLLAAVTSKLK